MEKQFDRRVFIRKYFVKCFSVFGGMIVLQGCNANNSSQSRDKENSSTDSCTDMSGVSDNDKKIRAQAAYVEKSNIPEKICSNCKLHIPPANGKECGGCMLFKGPVYSSAYCTYWAPLT